MAGETLLVVDDNADNLSVLKRILDRAGYRVRPADSGRVALASLRHSGADLILLDIMMPGMDGYEVCRALKAEPETRDIPVIFISGLDDPLDKVRAFESGGVDYVTKPFHELEVLERVKTHLQLHRMRRQLERHNEELERVVAERTAALRAANAGLQRALQARQDFLSLVSHELRTPLNGILGIATLLEYDLAPSQREFVGMIKSSGWSLLGLIDKILLMVQRGVGEAEPGDAPGDSVDIGRLCETCLKTVQPQAEQKRISTHLALQGTLPVGFAIPRARLYQIVGCLVDNAVRFTPEGGEVGIVIYHHPEVGELIIDVWDTGPGIPDIDKKRVFGSFVQLENVMTRRHDGLGLGLPLASRLARLHGGTVEVMDRPGGGSIFRVSLPTAAA